MLRRMFDNIVFWVEYDCPVWLRWILLPLLYVVFIAAYLLAIAICVGLLWQFTLWGEEFCQMLQDSGHNVLAAIAFIICLIIWLAMAYAGIYFLFVKWRFRK